MRVQIVYTQPVDEMLTNIINHSIDKKPVREQPTALSATSHLAANETMESRCPDLHNSNNVPSNCRQTEHSVVLTLHPVFSVFQTIVWWIHFEETVVKYINNLSQRNTEINGAEIEQLFSYERSPILKNVREKTILVIKKNDFYKMVEFVSP